MPDSKSGKEVPSSRTGIVEDDDDWNSVNNREVNVRQGSINVEPVSISTIDWTSGVQEMTDRVCHLFECNVCYELPHPDAMNQCYRGHIICDDCACRIFAEARINDQEALCPHCRLEITLKDLSKNTVVRQALWELPKQCRKCDAIMEHKFLAKHMKEKCLNRLVKCENYVLGCEWEGFYKASELHAKMCTFPSKLGAELLPILHKRDKKEFTPYIQIDRCYWKFSSFRIFYENVEVRWTGERNHYGEFVMHSKPFYAFEEQWKLTLVFKGGERSIPNSIDYSLRLQNMNTTTFKLSYFATIANSRSSSKQHDDICLKLQSQTFIANEPNQCQFNELPLEGFSPICRFLSLSAMFLRVWMFIPAKTYAS